MKPKWSYYIEEYLTYGHENSKLPKHQQKAIEVEVVDYALIDG